MIFSPAAEDRYHVVLGDAVAFERYQLVEGGERVAHSAFRSARDGQQSVFARLYAFAVAYLREVLDDERRRDAAEVEALAA